MIPHGDAIDALEAALRAGLDPEADPPRASVATVGGELLLMPSTGPRYAGVKLATVATHGQPRVQGVYVLFDAATMAPLTVLDGIALTSLRTSAVSALAVRHLAAPDASRLLVFGTGPQARSHVAAVRAVRPIEQVRVVGRDPGRVAAFAEECGAEPADPGAVAEADVICCCTTAREPLFDGGAVADHAVVVAVGSHEPEARETDEALAARAAVVVEARSAALREAGDVIAAIEAGALDPGALLTLDAVVRGEAALPAGGPRLFKSTGMAWEDLVVAAAVHERSAEPQVP